MFLDLINSFFELWAFLILFLIYTNISPNKRQLIIFTCFSVLLSIVFSYWLLPQILFLNLCLILSSVLISFWHTPIKTRLVGASLAILSILLLEFTLYSLLPSSLLQTNIGNLIANVFILLSVMLLLFVLRKKQSGLVLYEFIVKYYYVILVLLIVMIVLGQIYISNLSPAWQSLPAIVGLFFLITVIVCLALYIHFVNLAKQQQNDLFMRNLANTESIISACYTELHNYRSHINYLINSINSIDNIQELRSEAVNYASNLQIDRDLIESIIALKEPLFRSTIYGWYIRSLEQNIDFSFNASPLLPCFPIKQYQLVEILDVLFNNALEYELQLPEQERLISVVLYSDSDVSSFTISNHVTNVTDAIDNIYSGKSTKFGSHHGIGLKYASQLCIEHGILFSNSSDFDTSSVSFTLCYKKGSSV